MKDLINIRLNAQDRSDLLKKLNRVDMLIDIFWEARGDTNLIELINLSEDLIKDTADLIKSKYEWKDDRYPRHLYTANEDIVCKK